MKRKIRTSLVILMVLFMSLGNVNIVRASEKSITTIKNQQNSNNILERKSEKSKNQNSTTTTTSSAVKVLEDDSKLVDSSIKRSGTITYKNPIYKDLDLGFTGTQASNVRIAAQATVAATPTATSTFATIQDAANYMEAQMVKRAATIKFTINKPPTSSLYSDIVNMAMAYDDQDTSSEGDYLKGHWSGYSVFYSYTSTATTFTYNMSYLTTLAQEQAVNTEVKNVLNKLNVYNSNEYTKIKAVHDYIIQNVKYDYNYKNYSAYNAIINKNVVCNGFSLLTYKMLKELGVGVRFIVGNEGGHAWNIVRINGKWYNIDNTWDQNYYASNSSLKYSWFLKNNSDFKDHRRNAEYNTTSFNGSYPMSSTSYVMPK